MRTQGSSSLILHDLTHASGVIPIFEALGCEMIGKFWCQRTFSHTESGFTEVETDAEGLSSSSLREILENWPSSRPKPRILYTIPVRSDNSTDDAISIRG
jgi:hypothetical protein